ncbi:14208_t:CDS:2 [Cetraspora pellucida]|uniref:14208_t:CDS:1 n=1 Tax=Cetraspora pellucida TaxID=1433469 RepID=A0A9N9IYY2_9GLOM|nr:14208_t:CDS:2 [Cetraspora pellucida]
MQNSQDLDYFVDGREWDLAIELNLPENNYNINWNTLLVNYKLMTHLYRYTLQYKKINLFANWINANVQSETNIDLLNDIPESIVARTKRSREVIQPQIVVLPKLYTWNQKTDKYEVILKKNGDLTKLYPGEIYIQKFNSQSSTPIYELVHKPKQLQSQVLKRKTQRKNQNLITYCVVKNKKLTKIEKNQTKRQKLSILISSSPKQKKENKTFTLLRLLDFLTQFKLVSFTPKTEIQLNIPETETQLIPLFSPFKINLYLVQICEEQLAKKKDLTIEDVLVDSSDLIYHKFKDTVIPIVDYSVVIPCDNGYTFNNHIITMCRRFAKDEKKVCILSKGTNENIIYNTANLRLIIIINYIDYLYQLNVRNKDMPYNDKLKLGVNPGDRGTGYPVFFTN